MEAAGVSESWREPFEHDKKQQPSLDAADDNRGNRDEHNGEGMAEAQEERAEMSDGYLGDVSGPQNRLMKSVSRMWFTAMQFMQLMSCHRDEALHDLNCFTCYLLVFLIMSLCPVIRTHGITKHAVMSLSC
jgi:hypothetical protein